ncbi:hypothetical protein JTE90_016250 [Oedothorax gibbosus]|uniref:Uncharacterized protein n=1 Tax=Oedothorax gibbosus TaxID=931172 RepID=A0AAV6VTK1_9ARAC|nr:hypothetical protein JTE90_016250 [Oedothorax gibbosus]
MYSVGVLVGFRKIGNGVMFYRAALIRYRRQHLSRLATQFDIRVSPYPSRRNAPQNSLLLVNPWPDYNTNTVLYQSLAIGKTYLDLNNILGLNNRA